MEKTGLKDGVWDFHLRSLSANARDSSSANDPASDPNILESVRKIYDLTKEGGSGDLAARAYPQISKLFQRSVAALPNSKTSNGLLLLTIIQFFIDFGEIVLHDADPSLRTFFRSCLSREFAESSVAEATLDFLRRNKAKLHKNFPMLLPQFFPLLLKLIAWHGSKLQSSFLEVLPSLIADGSFLPLFSSLLDLPLLVVALERVERSSGTSVGNSIASLQKSAAPEMLLALMDEAYTGSTIEDRAVDPRSDDNSSIDVADPLFLDLLKDENDGLAERHWGSPGIAATDSGFTNHQSDRLRQACQMTPQFLSVYFSFAIKDASDSLLCALIPLLMTRNSTIFPDKIFSFEVRWRISEFLLAVFQRSPEFIALLKKPIIDRLGEAYDGPAKTELALHLCWAIGEHGGGGLSHRGAARELFESLELLLYENLSSSRVGLNQDSSISRKSMQARLLCFVVTAIAKLATCHCELLPRARVSLSKVARSRKLDRSVWRRASDFLGLMNEPVISTSVLGTSTAEGPGIIKWGEVGSGKMLAHIPFYLLYDQEGPPYHNFSFTDILPTEVPLRRIV